MTSPLTLSIVMEWENVRFSESSRVARVLAALAQQVTALAHSSTKGYAAVPVLAPVELIVLLDSEVSDGARVGQTVGNALAGCPDLVVRIEAAPGLAYFQMKNRGAALATGELIVFLDSDVIPQPGWLAALVGSFADPQVQAVASRAFVRPDSLYSRTVALTWLFGLPPRDAQLVPSTHFHANGAAFRRAVALAHPYPETPGQSRGAGWDLFLELNAAGITVFEQGAAQLDHPPPHGLVNYWLRAVVHGGDDHCSIRRRRGAAHVKLRRSVKRSLGKWRTGVGSLWREGHQVGLGLAGLPAAIGLVSMYFLGYLVGDLLARLHAAPAAAERTGNTDAEPTILPFAGPDSTAPAEQAQPPCGRRRAA